VNFNYHNVNQQMHTVRQNHNNVTKHQFLHVSFLTDPQPLSAQFRKTIF